MFYQNFTFDVWRIKHLYIKESSCNQLHAYSTVININNWRLSASWRRRLVDTWSAWHPLFTSFSSVDPSCVSSKKKSLRSRITYLSVIYLEPNCKNTTIHCRERVGHPLVQNWVSSAYVLQGIHHLVFLERKECCQYFSRTTHVEMFIYSSRTWLQVGV